MAQNLEAIKQQTIDIAHQAARTMMSRYEKPHDIVTKSSVFDVATEADKETEVVIKEALASAFPSHRLIGEESGATGEAGNADYVWYIDPIDGTSNYAAGIPHFCVSLAMASASGEPLVGVIYDPNLDEMFSATRGGGAFLNDKLIHVSDTDDLRYSVLGAAFPYTKQQSDHDDFRQFEYFVPRVRAMRRMGSAALELCYVAAGRLEAYWEWGLSRWDFYAGMLIVEEAGGQVTDFLGEKSGELYNGEQVLATNQALHHEMVEGMRHILKRS